MMVRNKHPHGVAGLTTRTALASRRQPRSGIADNDDALPAIR